MCYDRLQVHFGSDLQCIHLHGLTQHIFSLYTRALQDEEQEISKSNAEPEVARAQAARLRRRTLRWRKFRRCTVMGSVTDESGEPCSSAESSAVAL
eukprot:8985471-Pyramimonas_sp.AAC.1